MITIWVRHKPECPRKAERYSKRCRCPKWAQYQFHGRQVQVSLKTRSWTAANKKTRKMQDELDALERGETGSSRRADPVTLEASVQTYLRHLADAKKKRKASSLIKPKRMLRFLQEYCEKQNPPVIMLNSITPMLLENWRSTWTFKADSSSPRIHDAVARAFFKWALAMELIARDPYSKLDRYDKCDPQTLPLTPEEMKRILRAVNEVGKFTPNDRYNIRGLILCQRWSGLSIIDALTLSRTKLYPDNSLELRRTKTNEAVVTALPPQVAEHLRMMSAEHPGHFFWDGKEKIESLRARYMNMLRVVFDAAAVSRDVDGMALSHRFRDTFAVEFLQSGGRMEDLQELLGHSSIQTTHDHYAAWTPGRRDRLRLIAEESFQRQDKSMLQEPGAGETVPKERPQ
jgi:integrase/recombinase XerD